MWTNTLETNFPPEFVASKNKRYIINEQCKAIYNDTLIGDVIMHADFIERYHYCDYSACFINEQPNKDTAKSEYVGYKKQLISLCYDCFWSTEQLFLCEWKLCSQRRMPIQELIHQKQLLRLI